MHKKGVKLNRIIGSTEKKNRLTGDIDTVGKISLMQTC
jgi:hypothetical protein